MKQTKDENRIGLLNKDAFRLLAVFLGYFMLMLVLISTWDLVNVARTDKNAFEIRQIPVENIENGQTLYQLFKNGDYQCDVDINEYSLLDTDGNTDYKYCALIHSVRRLVNVLIIAGMMLLVVQIATSTARENTPFIKKNAERMKCIAVLALSLGILPGLIVFAMKTVRFEYIHGSFDVFDMYNQLLFVVIMFIAAIFEYGVKLQQDNDLIA